MKLKVDKVLKSCLMIIALGLVTTGCIRAVVQSEADLFFARHPELRSKYMSIEPVSPALAEDEVIRHIRLVDTIVSGLRREVDTNSIISLRLDKLEQLSKQTYEEELGEFKKISAELARVGGSCYYYSYKEGRSGEEGFMLIKDGEIRMKIRVVKTRIHSD